MINSILKNKLMGPGHLACPGCGAALAMRYALEVLGEKTIVIVPAGCWSTLIGTYPYSCLAVPVISVAFETTAATASGIRAGLDMKSRDRITVLAWAGDGGTFDIGFQALSGTAERNDDIIYVCYDNEAYMNTGIQRSSATPIKTWTTTTPASALKRQHKKNILEIMAAHKVPYAATASIGYPEDFMDKLKKAKRIKGTKFIHLLASCPTGWRHDPQLSIEMARLAVTSRVFPLYEVFKGEKRVLSDMPAKESVESYLNGQARFLSMSSKDKIQFQKDVDRQWRQLRKKCHNILKGKKRVAPRILKS